VELFETLPAMDARVIRTNAERFGAGRFRREFQEVLGVAWDAFQDGRDPERAVLNGQETRAP
jgi:hypothetical protein